MSGAKIDKLARMANQIGAAFATMPEREAVAGAATHLKLYWTPKMIREIVAFAETGRGRPQCDRGRRRGGAEKGRAPAEPAFEKRPVARIVARRAFGRGSDVDV